MKFLKSLFVLITPVLMLIGCTSHPVRTEDASHADIIMRNTQSVDKYNGFYQTFRASLTMLTPEVLTSNLEVRSKFLNWPDSEYQQQRQKMLQETALESNFFLKFYTPETDYDDLANGNSMWRIYLEFNGHRFNGKVQKISKNLSELSTLYPFFDRFSTAYKVTFPVAMSDLMRFPCKITITSSLGHAELSFQPRQ